MDRCCLFGLGGAQLPVRSPLLPSFQALLSGLGPSWLPPAQPVLIKEDVFASFALCRAAGGQQPGGGAGAMVLALCSMGSSPDVLLGVQEAEACICSTGNGSEEEKHLL